MKCYDENGNYTKKNYTFMDGPFQTEAEALSSAAVKAKEIMKTYKVTETENKKYFTQENDHSVDLVCREFGNNILFVSLDIVPVSTEIPSSFTRGAIKASVKGEHSNDKEIIKRRMQRKAKQALATITVA